MINAQLRLRRFIVMKRRFIRLTSILFCNSSFCVAKAEAVASDGGWRNGETEVASIGGLKVGRGYTLPTEKPR